MDFEMFSNFDLIKIDKRFKRLDETNESQGLEFC